MTHPISDGPADRPRAQQPDRIDETASHWVRFRDPGGATCFGTLEGKRVRVCEGNLYDSPVPTDRTLPLADVQLLCGTSIGVGSMKPGSTVEVEIAGIGVLANRFEQ